MKNQRFWLLSGLSFVWVCLLTVNVHGQSCYGSAVASNELGVRLVSLSDASNAGGISVPGEASSVGFLNGIHYKRYGGIGAFRASLGLTRYEHEDRRNCPDCLRTDGRVSQVRLRAGYEAFAILGLVELFAGIDAIAAFGTYEGETFSTGSGPYYETTDNRDKRGFGLGPVAGLRVFLGQTISLSAETGIEAMMYGRRTTISQISPETMTVSRKSNFYETTFHPINWLSLNVMF